MKIAAYTLSIFLTLNFVSNGQSIIDLGKGTDLNIGAGSDVCADVQTGGGSLTGDGNFCGGVLPVELSSFVSLVQYRDVILNWTTVFEVNNRGFEIERSIVNGQLPVSNDQWIKIGFVSGNGTTLEAGNFSFTDKNLTSGNYNYRIKQIDFNGNFEYFILQNEVVISNPDKFFLSQNYPNPFNPVTKIDFDLPVESKVRITIINMTGKEVDAPLNEQRQAGYYSININASNLSSGVYFYKITAEGNAGQKFTDTKKMIVLK